MADCGVVAVERLESALYRIETGGSTNAAQVDALASCAASLIRLAAQPSPGLAHHDAQQLAQLIADVAALRESWQRVATDHAQLAGEVSALRGLYQSLVARVDRLEDAP